MINKQVKPKSTKIAIQEYVMENMFCLPKGALGQLGGHLMSRDIQLPAWVVSLLEINPSDSVLEVGSGPGVGLEIAAERAYRGWVVGVDPSETMLEMAQRRNHELIEAGRVQLRGGRVERLPFEDAVFDKAMAMNSLHLWPDRVAGLMEIKRTLKPGGLIAIAFTRFSYASAAWFERDLVQAGFADVTVHVGEAGTCVLGRVPDMPGERSST
jgi:ubiquinone/menaquinone biosynthesis C-methylase UbiE